MPAMKVLSAAFLGAGLLPSPALAADSTLACSEHSHMGPVVSMAPDCFAACPQVCSPLAAAILLSGEGKDPRPTICSNINKVACIYEPAHHSACGELPKRTNDLGANVPTTVAELRAVCGLHNGAADTPPPVSAASRKRLWAASAALAAVVGALAA